MLGRVDRPRSQKRRFAYTGLIRCGSCDRAITAEQKINRHGRRYVYYHCVKRAGDRCPEPAIEERDLERQMLSFLRSLPLPDAAFQDAQALLDQEGRSAGEVEEARLKSVTASIRSVEGELRELLDLRIRSFIDDEEYVRRRLKLDLEKARLSESLVARVETVSVIEPARTAYSFVFQVATLFEQGDFAVRRTVIETVGSNPLLTGKKLSIQAAKPFTWVAEITKFRQRCGVVDGDRTPAAPGDSGGDSALEAPAANDAGQPPPSPSRPAAEEWSALAKDLLREFRTEDCQVRTAKAAELLREPERAA